MKIFFLFPILITCWMFPSSTSSSIQQIEKNNMECDSSPALNKQIIDFVRSKIKKKVGRGECWDLAAEALNLVSAKWDGKYKYGKEVFADSDCIFPGDIIQFEGVIIKYTIDGVEYKEKMAHHTAIVYEVNGEGDFMLAHQNTAFTGKKVGLSPLQIVNISKGKFKVYRPIK